jgi:parallel beta-helix repeat protein
MVILTVAFLCLVMPVSIFSIDSQLNIEVPKVLGTRAVTITNNAQLATEADSGAGSSGNPYIILNRNINGASGTHCISVANTNSYFIIRGATLYNANNGVILSNVQNGQVETSEIYNCGIGIYVTNTDYSNLNNNTIHDNTGDGIKLNNGNTYIEIMDNDCYDNGHDGIAMWWFTDNNYARRNNCTNNANGGITIGYFSDYNIIQDNDCYINNVYGIYIRDCDWNELIDNECEHNYMDGIYLTYAGNTTIKGNDVWDNTVTGVKLFNANYTKMSNNIFKKCGLVIMGDSLINWNTHTIDTTNKVNGKSLRYLKNLNTGTIPADAGQVILANCTNVQCSSKDFKHASIGVQLGYSRYCTVDQCNVSENQHGIYISHSQYNNITNNEANDETWNGIYLHYSKRNYVDDNDAYNNVYGILIRFSESNTISNNSANYNVLGYFLWDSNKNDLFQNDGVHNSNCSVSLEDSVNNTIRYGNASNNGFKGIWAKFSDENTILGNDCNDNLENGIYLFESESNYIAHNYASGHPEQGILVEFFSRYTKLYYNHVYDNDMDGILLRLTCKNAEIYGNEVYDNGINGINVIDTSHLGDVSANHAHHNVGCGIRIYQSNQFGANDNNVHDNVRGILFAYSSQNQIHRNLAENNSHSGICVDFNSDGSVLTKNRLVNNNHGIYIASSQSNEVKWNNFIGNTGTKQSYDGTFNNQWNGLVAGNFWDDWTSPDTNGDFIVDNPYILDGAGDQDDFPLALEAGQIKIITANDPDAYEDTLYSNTYSILQINQPPTQIFWSVQSNASWLSIDATGTLSGTPVDADTGTAWVKVIADDGTPLNRDSTNFTITVHNIDFPPDINVTDDKECFEDELYYVDYNASDNDPGFIHTWSLVTDAGFLTMNNSTGELSGIPLNEHVGTYLVTVRVSDGVFNDSQAFNLTVINTNDNPNITSEDETWTRALVNYAVWYQAEDEDPTNDKLEWFLHTNATFLWILRSNGTLGGTPLEEDVGTYWVNVTVKDGKGGFDFSNFTLEVAPKLGDKNRPPVVYVHPGTITILEDDFDGSLILTDWFTDPDWNKLTFRSDPCVNISIDIKANDNVYLTPLPNWCGSEILTFYANDSEFEIHDSVNVTVTPVNDPPLDAVIMFENRPYYANQSQPAWGNITDVDIPYGDTHTYHWSTNETGNIDIAQSINLSLPEGEYIVKLIVTDSGGESDEISKNIVILADPGTVDPDDTDADGLPDLWEDQYFGNLDQGPNDDFDNDGATNLEEYNAGTDPTVDENKKGDDDGDKSFLDENWWWLLILLVVVILIIIIIIVILATRSKQPVRPPPREPYPSEEEYQSPQPRREPEYRPPPPQPDYSDTGTMPSTEFRGAATAPVQEEESSVEYSEEEYDEPVASPYEGLDTMSDLEGSEDEDEEEFDLDEEEEEEEDEDYGEFDLDDEDESGGDDYSDIDDFDDEDGDDDEEMTYIDDI